jgi:hypothetical protein
MKNEEDKKSVSTDIRRYTRMYVFQTRDLAGIHQYEMTQMPPESWRDEDLQMV